MKYFIFTLTACSLVAIILPTISVAQQPIKVMIIGGQNNHDWKKSTPFMKELLDKSDRFDTVVDNAPESDASASDWNAWRPQFKDFDCIVLDYNGQMWPNQVKQDFVDYIAGGGGAIVIHAANNSFNGWKEFEQMVGLLWRDPKSGYSLYVDDHGKVVRVEPGEGRGMGHGSQYDWVMTTQESDHPITKGMPLHWMHKKDELYHGQRGPAENIHILLSAYSDPAPERRGTGKNEPIVWWVPFGKGKVVTNLIGHVGSLQTMQCVGFKVLLYRGIEWVATGKCTTAIPDNFPTADKTVLEE
jgi:trehalose utilization protein